jgi:hypothetical protein
MKNLKIILVALVFFALVGESNAQFFNKLKNGDWVLGAGWNFVDDNGKPLTNIFGQAGAWNSLAYPSAVRVEKNYNPGLSFVFNGSYNQYRNSKDVNNSFNQSSTFYALDLSAKYNFVALYDINAEWFNFATDVFDVYGTFGGGFTSRSTARVGNAGTMNLGIGVNAYVYGNWGINIDATSKFGFTDGFWDTPTNYRQYSIGVIYKLSNTKRLYGTTTRKSRPVLN